MPLPEIRSRPRCPQFRPSCLASKVEGQWQSTLHQAFAKSLNQYILPDFKTRINTNNLSHVSPTICKHRGTWRISQSLRPKSIKAKFAVLVIAPRCFVGVTSVRRVTEAGPPTPMATPKHILSSAQQSGPWRSRNSWKGPKLDLTHDKESPSKGAIWMYDVW